MNDRTPGPWEFVVGPPMNVHNDCVTSSPGGTVFARRGKTSIVVASHTYSVANARAIAALPELIASLRGIASYEWRLDAETAMHDAQRMAREALKQIDLLPETIP